jgi:hypothetical protein
MPADRQSVRESAAKVAGTMAQGIDSSLAPAAVFNSEIVALGMVAELGAPAGTELHESLRETQREGIVRVSNKATEDSPELIAARKSGSLERVLRAKRQQASTREEKATSPGESRRPLKEIYDFSQYDDDEIGLIDTSTLTADSAEAYSQELDQRTAGAGSFAEAQAWEVDEDEDDETELEFSPVLPWERRDVNGNLYEGEDV